MKHTQLWVYNRHEVVRGIWKRITSDVQRKLGIGKNQMYALRDKEGIVTTNMDETVKIAEEYYIDLYRSRGNQDVNGRISAEELDIPPVTPDEVKESLRRNAKR